MRAGIKTAAANGNHGIVFCAGVLDFFRQSFDYAVDVVVGVPDFTFHGVLPKRKIQGAMQKASHCMAIFWLFQSDERIIRL